MTSCCVFQELFGELQIKSIKFDLGLTFFGLGIRGGALCDLQK